jgi:hypothetical protein
LKELKAHGLIIMSFFCFQKDTYICYFNYFVYFSNQLKSKAMKKETQDEILIKFLYSTKEELTLRKIKIKEKKLITFKGTPAERKALKRSTPNTQWSEVQKHLKNKINNLFTGKTDIGNQIGNWKRQGVPKMILRNFQEAGLLGKIK